VLPAATYDLAVGAEGFVPQRRAKTVVQVGRNLDLGAFELEPSQSVAGWLAVDEGVFDASTLLLRVVPADDAPNPRMAVYQGDPLLVERTVKSDGSFRITNVRAGTWNVEARSPGYLTAVGTPVQVAPGRTTALEQPLILHRPFDLEVVVEPPVDGEGRPWILSGGPIRTWANGRQTRVPETFEVVGEGKGLYRLTRQGPGRFWFAVNDPEENVFVSRYDVEVRSAAEARQTIRVPILEVEGRVTLGLKAVQGDIFWNDPDGVASFRAESDEDGRFTARMSGPGNWRFWIFPQEGNLAQLAVEVVEDRPGHATLDLRLPATRFFGRVEDEEGRTKAEVAVHVVAPGFADELVSEADGAFAAEGLPEGKVTLRATTTVSSGYSVWRVSESVEIDLTSGRPEGPIVLRLLPAQALQGKVVDVRGREPEESVSLHALLEDDADIPARTDEGGAFSIDVPVASDRVTLLLRPSGGALRAFDLRLGASPPILRLESDPGVVRVDLASSWGRIQATGRTLELEQDGVRIPLERLFDWSLEQGRTHRDHDRALAFAALAPGRYRVCLGPEAWFGRIDAGARRKGGIDCDTGVLTAGGELRLSLP
jgi:hypothetical protein